MPKEIFDIVDTAVKIGLGAAIGGISSYYMAARNFRYEQLKKASENRHALIMSIAEQFEHSHEVMNEAVVELRSFLYGNTEESGLNTKLLLGHLSKAETHIGKAKANANLLGLDALFTALQSYAGSQQTIIEAIENLNDTEESREKLIGYWSSTKEKQLSIYPLITDAYSKVNA